LIDVIPLLLAPLLLSLLAVGGLRCRLAQMCLLVYLRILSQLLCVGGLNTERGGIDFWDWRFGGQ
jgi:hypothetical protein